jgi:hypothetical protein
MKESTISAKIRYAGKTIAKRGDTMPHVIDEKAEQEAILAEVDAFVSDSIDKMTPRQLKRFREQSAKIMSESSRRVHERADDGDRAQLPLRAPRV